jgi:hypothetical protein
MPADLFSGTEARIGGCVQRHVFPHVPSVVPPARDGPVGDSCSWLAGGQSALFELLGCRLGHGLDVRGELSVQQRVHGETERLGGSLDLIRVEAEAGLHVRAGDREYRAAG